MPQDWNQRLKAGYKTSSTEPHRPVRLPADGPIRVTGEGDHVIVELRADAVHRNMQENTAAFEGWCLALRYWCNAERITLKWQPPVPPADPMSALTVEQRHYQRFLYRVERFGSLFDWFDVAMAQPFAHSRVVNRATLYLNVAGTSAKGLPSHGATVSKRFPEHELECRLLEEDEFDRHFGFGKGSIKDRQFPVGLFSEPKPTTDSAIFPGGKGAIDLVCLDDRHFWLFELKAEKNIPIGTIAELLFYVSVMRDAVLGKFKFDESRSSKEARGKIKHAEIKHIKAITGVMLGHDLHPLLADSGLVQLLNDAVEARWNRDVGAPAVSFRADKIRKDFTFTRIERD